MRCISVPEIRCPFPLGINSAVEIAEEQASIWIMQTGMIQGEQEFVRFLKAKFSFYTSRLYPESNDEDLCWLNQWMIYFILLDDLLDEEWSERETEAFISDLQRFFTASRNTVYHFAQHPFWETFRQLWQAILPRMTPVMQSRYAQNILNHLLARPKEQAIRAGAIPSIDQYIENRHFTGGAYISFSCLEIALNIDLPDPLFQEPDLQQLMRSASNLTSWINDLYSLEKELKNQDQYNLVLVVQTHHHCSLEQAMHIAGDMVNQEIQRFIAVEQAFRQKNADLYLYIESYIRGLKFIVRATLDWSIASGRYASSTNSSR